MSLATWELPAWKRDDLDTLSDAELYDRAHELMSDAARLAEHRNNVAQQRTMLEVELAQARRERDFAVAASRAGIDAGPALERVAGHLDHYDWAAQLTHEEATRLLANAAAETRRALRERDAARLDAADVHPKMRAAMDALLVAVHEVVKGDYLKASARGSRADLSRALSAVNLARGEALRADGETAQ